MMKKPLIVLTGPTAVGKTKLSIALAKADEKIASLLDGKTIIKEIYVPGKIVNIVAK